MRSNLIDLSFISQNTGGDPEFLKEMVELLLKRLPEDVEKLKQAAKKKEWQQVSSVAHKIKPNLDMIGVAVLKDKVRYIETKAGEQNELEKVESEVENFVETMQQVIKELEVKRNEL